MLTIIGWHENVRYDVLYCVDYSGLPVTPGGSRKTPLTSRTPRSRMSISESTGSQTSSPQRPIILSPSRSHVMIQSRPIPSSPQQTRQMPIGGHLKPTVNIIYSLFLIFVLVL